MKTKSDRSVLHALPGAAMRAALALALLFVATSAAAECRDHPILKDPGTTDAARQLKAIVRDGDCDDTDNTMIRRCIKRNASGIQHRATMDCYLRALQAEAEASGIR